MTNQMARATLSDADLQQVFSDQRRQLIGMNGVSPTTDKQVCHATVGYEHGTYIAKILGDPADRPHSDGNDPILLPLAQLDRHDLSFDVEVVHVQLN